MKKLFQYFDNAIVPDKCNRNKNLIYLISTLTLFGVLYQAHTTSKSHITISENKVIRMKTSLQETKKAYSSVDIDSEEAQKEFDRRISSARDNVDHLKGFGIEFTDGQYIIISDAIADSLKHDAMWTIQPFNWLQELVDLRMDLKNKNVHSMEEYVMQLYKISNRAIEIRAAFLNLHAHLNVTFSWYQHRLDTEITLVDREAKEFFDALDKNPEVAKLWKTALLHFDQIEKLEGTLETINK